jgi:hypothetical protein
VLEAVDKLAEVVPPHGLQYSSTTGSLVGSETAGKHRRAAPWLQGAGQTTADKPPGSPTRPGVGSSAVPVRAGIDRGR